MTFRLDHYTKDKMLRFRRVGTTLVAAVYGLTNVAATYAVETGLWEERRSARFRAPQVAGLLSSPQRPILWKHFPFDGGSSTSQPPSTFKRLAVPFDVASAVLPYGAIGEVQEGRRGAPVVFLVQDVHGNEGAQKNIGGLLTALASRGVAFSGLEGAAVPLDLDPYHRHPVPQAVRLVADALRVSGRLSGAEWAGLISTQSMTLSGIESAPLYKANLASAKECVARRPATDVFLSALNKTLQSQKNDVYSVELKSFDRHRESYGEGREGLSAYARFLGGLPGGKTLVGPQVKKFLCAVEWETYLNFSQVESDRRSLMDELSKGMRVRDLEELLSRAVAYRAGQTTNGDFFAFLRSLCQRKGYSLDRYPHFRDYLDYVGVIEGINRKELMTELAQWEIRVGDTLARNDTEKNLLALDRDAALLSSLLENEMSPEKWVTYQNNRNSILALPGRLGGADMAPFQELSRFVRPHEDFCRLAMDRNSALAENFAAQVQAKKATQGVLVAGGFHTPGLQSELSKRGYSTVVITPRIQKVEGKPLDVFARDPLPLNQLFAGKPISLSPELLTGQALGRSFLDLIITAEGLSLVSSDTESGGKAREWASRKGFIIKSVDHTSDGFVRVFINGRGGVRLLVKTKGTVEKNIAFYNGETVEKVELPNGHVVWLSTESPPAVRRLLVTTIYRGVFLRIKSVLEKMWSHGSHLFSNPVSEGLVGNIFYRAFPLLSLRLPIVPLSETSREVSSHPLLAEPYLRYDALVRQMVNPRGGAFSLLYGGSGADLSNGLLLANFTRAFFVSPTHGMTVSDFARIKRGEVREDPLYAQEKYDDGFSDGSRLNGKEKLMSSLSLELKGMSVPFDSLEVFEWQGRPGLRFPWKAPGETTATSREIVFVDADITQPAQYKDVLLERFDLYLQRAGMLIPWAYRDRNSFIKVIAKSMNPGAFFATDDDALDEPGEFVDQGHHFPLDLPILPIQFEQELLNQVIALRYKGAGFRAWANRQREGYGFLLRIRRMPETLIAVPPEANVLAPGRLLGLNNENKPLISKKGNGISLSMGDGQGQEIGNAVFLGKRERLFGKGPFQSSPPLNGIPNFFSIFFKGTARDWVMKVHVPAWLNPVVNPQLPGRNAFRSVLLRNQTDVRLKLRNYWKCILESGGMDKKAIKGLRQGGLLPHEGGGLLVLPKLARLELALWNAADRTSTVDSLGFPVQAFVVGGSRIFFSENRGDVDVLLCYQPDESLSNWIQPLTVQAMFLKNLSEIIPLGTTVTPTDEGARISWSDLGGSCHFDLNIHPVSKNPFEAQYSHLNDWLVNFSRDPLVLNLARTYYFGSLDQWGEDLVSFLNAQKSNRSNGKQITLPVPGLTPDLQMLLENRLSIPASVFAARIPVGSGVSFPFTLVQKSQNFPQPESFHRKLRNLFDLLRGKRNFDTTRGPGIASNTQVTRNSDGPLGGSKSLAKNQLSPGIVVDAQSVFDLLTGSERQRFRDELDNLMPKAKDFGRVEVYVDLNHLSGEGIAGEINLPVLNTPLTNNLQMEMGAKLAEPQIDSIAWGGRLAQHSVGETALRSAVKMAAQRGEAALAGAALAALDDALRYPHGPDRDKIAEVISVLLQGRREGALELTQAFADSYNRVQSGLLSIRSVGGQLGGKHALLDLTVLFKDNPSKEEKNRQAETWVALGGALSSLSQRKNSRFAFIVRDSSLTRAQVQTLLRKAVPPWDLNSYFKGDSLILASERGYFHQGKFSLGDLRNANGSWKGPVHLVGFDCESLVETEGTLKAWGAVIVPVAILLDKEIERIIKKLEFVRISA